VTDSFSFDADTTDALRMLKNLPDSVADEVNKATKRTAFTIMANAVKSISADPSPGITYKKYHKKKNGGGFRGNHTASKPGDAPNSDTGNLVQSITVIKLKPSGGLDQYSIGSPLDYAAWLEFGTLDMAARPWLSPAVDKAEAGHIERVTKAVKKGIKDAEH
jgi:HK97 gp10 family phage protein